MREFVYYSAKARTSGNFTDLMKAGRIDIVCNVIIQAFFISNQMREDIHLHLIFDGQPNPPMHLEFISNPDMSISKKDVGGLINISLTGSFLSLVIEMKVKASIIAAIIGSKKFINIFFINS